ncbi:MAG: exopolyphosphatase, partial [Flexibacteraceae bacterium]
MNTPEIPRYAVIDMGTNTFHLLIAELAPDGFKVLHKEKVGVKLGKGSINQGFLSDDAIERGLDCLQSFANTAVSFGIAAKDIIATATSAVRSANNGQFFVEQVLAKTEIKVQVIDGAKEAQLIFEGVTAALGKQSAASLIMDIGGGSVEFIIGNKEQYYWKQSFEVGAIRLHEKFKKHDPILSEEISEINLYLSEKLKPLFDQIKL